MGCSSATTFFCGVSAQQVFSTCFRSRGAWDPTRTRNVHKTVLRREKGISPAKCGFSQNQKDKKKKHNQQSITDEASHASRQPRRTNSDSSTDRRPTTRGPIQIQGRARGTSYRSPTRAPLPRAYTERGRIGAEPSRVTRTLVWCLRVTTSRLERERERASSFRAPFECIDDDDGGPSSPSSRCLGDETTPNSA